MSGNIDLTDPIFHDEDKAREWLEAKRWPNGPFCPHCGSTNVARMGGTSGRPGLFHCPDCRGQFTVRTGQVMERSHIPLTKWVLAFHLMTASKKGVSAHQLHRTLDIAYNSAWFMAHRIREAMNNPGPLPLGGEGKIVEADETYYGKQEMPQPRSRNAVKNPTKRGRSGPAGKRPVVALVERGGEARAVHMPRVTASNVREVLVRNADRKSRLHTDESNLLSGRGRGICQARDGAPLGEGIRARRRSHQLGRRLFRPVQARHGWRVSSLRRAAPATLPGRVQLPLFQPLKTRHRRCRARGYRPQASRGEASDMAAD
jgi:transposase-like protein